MNSFKLNLNVIQQFISANNLSEKISYKEIKNIFDESNQYLEDGTKGVDEYLTGDEVPTFQKLLREKCSGFSKYIGRLMNSIVTENDGQPAIAKCNKTTEQQQLYENNLKEAKNILETNQKQLQLTDEEINYIKNAAIVVENYGSARYDRESDVLLFNLNDGISIPDVGSIVKVLIHEATHASIKSAKDTKEEERLCETRALEAASKLRENGKIDNFIIMQGSKIRIDDLKTEKERSDFIEQWLKLGYKDTPSSNGI